MFVCIELESMWTNLDIKLRKFESEINIFPNSNQNIYMFGLKNHAYIWKYTAHLLNNINFDVCQQFPVHLWYHFK